MPVDQLEHKPTLKAQEPERWRNVWQANMSMHLSVCPLCRGAGLCDPSDAGNLESGDKFKTCRIYPSEGAARLGALHSESGFTEDNSAVYVGPERVA